MLWKLVQLAHTKGETFDMQFTLRLGKARAHIYTNTLPQNVIPFPEKSDFFYKFDQQKITSTTVCDYISAKWSNYYDLHHH